MSTLRTVFMSSGHTWNFNGTYSGEVSFISGGFSNIKNVVGSNNGGDVFNLNAGSVMRQIEGQTAIGTTNIYNMNGGDCTRFLIAGSESEGSDTFNINSDNLITGIVYGYGGTSPVGNETDLLQDNTATARTWSFSISQHASGNVDGMEFSYMANLQGGSGNDTFQVNYIGESQYGPAPLNSLNGGGGYNTLDLYKVPFDRVYYNFQTNEGYIPGYITAFSNINQLILNPFTELINYFSIIDIVSKPEVNVVESREDKGISLTQGSTPALEAAERFIVKDVLGEGEINFQ